MSFSPILLRDRQHEYKNGRVVSPTLLKTIIVFVNWEQVFCVIYINDGETFFSMCNITAQYCYLLVISFITIVSFWRNYHLFIKVQPGQPKKNETKSPRTKN